MSPFEKYMRSLVPNERAAIIVACYLVMMKGATAEYQAELAAEMIDVADSLEHCVFEAPRAGTIAAIELIIRDNPEITFVQMLIAISNASDAGISVLR